MALVAANCPHCGAGIQIPDDRDACSCTYCGQNIIIERDEPSPAQGPASQDIRNFVDLAETAEASGSYEEAHKYWSQVLERDPKNVVAWIGKGISAGWQSTLAVPRIAEAITCLRKAIALRIPSKDLVQKAATGGHGVAVGFYNLAFQHYQQFQQELTNNTCSSGLLDVLVNASQINVATKQNAVQFANFTIASLELSCTVWQELDKTPQMAHDITTMCQQLLATKALTPEAIGTYQGLLATVQAWGKQHDSQWDQKRKTGCFVATATLGDCDHPVVTTLRQFRDEWLSSFASGRRFIEGYYRFGPFVADVIRRSQLLRILSYAFLVKPASLLARMVLTYSQRTNAKRPFFKKGIRMP